MFCSRSLVIMKLLGLMLKLGTLKEARCPFSLSQHNLLHISRSWLATLKWPILSSFLLVKASRQSFLQERYDVESLLHYGKLEIQLRRVALVEANKSLSKARYRRSITRSEIIYTLSSTCCEA